jgi:hypothetical protein
MLIVQKYALGGAGLALAAVLVWQIATHQPGDPYWELGLFLCFPGAGLGLAAGAITGMLVHLIASSRVYTEEPTEPTGNIWPPPPAAIKGDGGQQ